MRPLGCIVRIAPGVYLADETGAILAFATEADARQLAGPAATIVPLARHRKPRVRRSPNVERPSVTDLMAALDESLAAVASAQNGHTGQLTAQLPDPPVSTTEAPSLPAPADSPAVVIDPDGVVALADTPPAQTPEQLAEATADHPFRYEDPPEPTEHDPGPECDDEGGMSEVRAMIAEGGYDLAPADPGEPF